MAVLVSTIIVYLLGWISQAILNWLSGVYTSMFYLAFAIEIAFRDISTTFSISGLYTAIYIIAIIFLVFFFAKKLIETYMLWSNGDPDENPLYVIIGFVKAMIVMICFGFIYTQFVNIFYGMYSNLLMGMTGSISPVAPEYKNLGLNVFGAFLYLIIAIQLTILYFQFLTRGFEMLVLRLGIPFASIGLLNANQGAFKGYIQKFINNAFTIIVQLLLVQFSILLLNGGHFVLAFTSSSIALRTPQMLNEFMISSGGGSTSGKINTVSRVVTMFRSGISKGK
ncbi:MAG: DUF6102 family protein [Clostridia bacterium]|nr:DUF6102 family protein [Clostridia bacterium]